MVWSTATEVTSKQAYPNVGVAGVMVAGYTARNTDITEQSGSWVIVTEQTGSWA